MSIIHTFDNKSKALIEPNIAIRKVDGFPETVLVAWAYQFAEIALRDYRAKQIDALNAGSPVPIYGIDFDGTQTAFYLSPIGGPTSVGLLEEILAKGAKKVLFFGSCGALSNGLEPGTLLIPISAYRDEGTSYHYALASDFVEIESARRLAAAFDGMGVAYRMGKVWTTDAFYRETRNNVALRKNNGCLAVEMECASIMACAQFRRANVYEFVYVADCLDGEAWLPRTLFSVPDGFSEQVFRLALETSCRL